MNNAEAGEAEDEEMLELTPSDVDIDEVAEQSVPAAEPGSGTPRAVEPYEPERKRQRLALVETLCKKGTFK